MFAAVVKFEFWQNLYSLQYSFIHLLLCFLPPSTEAWQLDVYMHSLLENTEWRKINKKYAAFLRLIIFHISLCISKGTGCYLAVVISIKLIKSCADSFSVSLFFSLWQCSQFCIVPTALDFISCLPPCAENRNFINSQRARSHEERARRAASPVGVFEKATFLRCMKKLLLLWKKCRFNSPQVFCM